MVSPAIEKFLNRIQGIQQFVAVRSGRNQAYEAAFRDIQAIVTLLTPPEFEQSVSPEETPDAAPKKSIQTQLERARLTQAKLDLLNVLDRLEQHLTQEQMGAEAKLDRIQQQLRERSLDQWRNHAKQLIRAFNLEKEEFFRTTKGRLNRRRLILNTNFIPDSLPYQMGVAIESFTPISKKQKHRTHLFLQMHRGDDTHAALLNLCGTVLSQWHQSEQELLYTNRSSGLLALLERYQRHFADLKIDTLAIDTLIEKLPDKPIDWQSKLEFLSESIEQPKNYSYFDNFEDITGAVIRLVLQIGFIAVVFIFNRFIALLLVVGMLFNLLNITSQMLAAPHKRQSRIEQTTTSLKQQLTTAYHAISRYLLEETIQNLNTLLEAEEQQLRRAIDAIDEQLNLHYSEIKRHQEEARTTRQTCLQEKAQIIQVKTTLQAGL